MSIWNKKHMFVADKNGQVVVKLDDKTYDIIWVRKDKPLQDAVVFGENGIKFIEEYCYIDDLIAQVDKAERLQKAVDLVVDVLETAQKTESSYKTRWIDSAIYTIKQLIKE